MPQFHAIHAYFAERDQAFTKAHGSTWTQSSLVVWAHQPPIAEEYLATPLEVLGWSGRTHVVMGTQLALWGYVTPWTTQCVQLLDRMIVEKVLTSSDLLAALSLTDVIFLRSFSWTAQELFSQTQKFYEKYCAPLPDAFVERVCTQRSHVAIAREVHRLPMSFFLTDRRGASFQSFIHLINHPEFSLEKARSYILYTPASNTLAPDAFLSLNQVLSAMHLYGFPIPAEPAISMMAELYRSPDALPLPGLDKYARAFTGPVAPKTMAAFLSVAPASVKTLLWPLLQSTSRPTR